MRKVGTLTYLLTDHLGSTAVVATQSGGSVAQQLYKPWGESRWISGTLPTDRKFTGQRSEEATLGSLYDYGARAYSPRLGRFLSADTIVPSPGNPQSLNRYSYTLNNPTRFTDPSGHYEVEDDGYRHSARPPRDTRYDWMIAYDLNDLLQEPEPILLTRVVWGETRNRPEASPQGVAAVFLVRAVSDYGGYGRTLRAQLLKPHQSLTLSPATDPSSPLAVEAQPNYPVTMNPTLETNGPENFAAIYEMALPMHNAMLQGDYSLLPDGYTGPDAPNAFWGDGMRHHFEHNSLGIWPWPGMQREVTTPRLPRGKQAWMEGF